MPKVSVIIPVYNTEKYLRECLDSIVNQTLSDIEIICVNDASTDNSLEILKEYASKDERVKIIEQENLGAGAARNNGISVATGDYLYFLDSDDYADVTLLEKAYNKITEKNSDICIFNYHKYFDKSKKIKKHDFYPTKIGIVDEEISLKKYPNDIYDIVPMVPFLKLYNKDFVLKNNIKYQNLTTCNDVYFNCITLALAESIVCLDDALVVSRREREGSITSCRGGGYTKYLNCHEGC